MASERLIYAIGPDDLRTKALEKDYIPPAAFNHRSKHLSVPRIASPMSHINPYRHFDTHTDDFIEVAPCTTP